jgi:hypothetical protein
VSVRHFLIILSAVGGLLLPSANRLERVQAQSAFASQIASLSEPDGYFDTDNLISNERSYLRVLPDLERAKIAGGAYIGVGPDQNFSYIAALRPSIAFIIDVRRDNLLLHLLFKALFALSRTRVEYLSLLLGRPVPADVDAWRTADVAKLVGAVEAAPLDSRQIPALRARIDDAIAKFGVPLSKEDRATIDRFHRRFIDAGVRLRFQSAGRAPQSDYPTYRELLLETDPHGRHGNYLASEEAFQFLKTLQAKDLVIPVTGDLSGPAALAAIAKMLGRRGERLSAFYASNVEFYLFGEGRFSRFAENLGRLPRHERAVVIRSVFRPWIYGLGAGDPSVSLLQPVGDLLKSVAVGRVRSYEDLLTR